RRPSADDSVVLASAGRPMRDGLVGEAVKLLRTGVNLPEVKEGVGADFRADEWTEVQRRLGLRLFDVPLRALIEEQRTRELAGRAAAAERREAEMAGAAREQTALSRRTLIVALLALLVAVITTGVALYTNRQTVREMHFTAGVQTLLALHQEFESEPMHQT